MKVTVKYSPSPNIINDTEFDGILLGFVAKNNYRGFLSNENHEVYKNQADQTCAIVIDCNGKLHEVHLTELKISQEVINELFKNN